MDYSIAAKEILEKLVEKIILIVLCIVLRNLGSH
jgi:hypothetical protein